MTRAGARVHASDAAKTVANWPLALLLEVLRTADRPLAAAAHYCDVLLNHQPAESRTGIAALDAAFGSRPLVATAEGVLEAGFRRVASELSIADALTRRDTGVLEWLLAVGPTVRELVGAQPPEQQWWMGGSLRAIDAAAETLGSEMCSVASAGRLLDELDRACAELESGLADLTEPLHRERSRLEEELAVAKAASRSLAGLLTRRGRARERVQELERQLASVEAVLAAITAHADGAHRLLLDVTNGIAVPMLVRAHVTDAARTEADALVARFRLFAAAVGDAVRLRRERAVVPPPDRIDTTGVATPRRLDLLYDRYAGHAPMGTRVTEMFRMSGGGTASYSRCANVAAHFEAGAATLLDRMADFAAALFAPTLSLTALDVLEAEGAKAAKEDISKAVSRAGTPIDFSPSLVAAHSPRGTLPSNVIWADELSRLRLLSDYAAQFSADAATAEATDAHVIEIAGLCLGFPAFAIHLLEECRQAAGVSVADDPRDIWPR